MNKLEELQKTLDREKWLPTEVPKTYSALVESIHNPDAELHTDAENMQRLLSDEIQYWATKSLLLLVTLIQEYVELIPAVSAAAFETASCLLDTIKVGLI